MTVEDLSPQQIEARQRARAEILANRDRVARERQARTRQAEAADVEIAREIHARRNEEARQAEIRAERERMYALREIALEEQREAERKAKLESVVQFRQAEAPERKLAKRLRASLGDQFDDFLMDLRGTNMQQLGIELRRIPDDERAAALAERHAETARRMNTESMIVPEPEDEIEAAIVARYGLGRTVAQRRAELDEGAL